MTILKTEKKIRILKWMIFTFSLILIAMVVFLLTSYFIKILGIFESPSPDALPPALDLLPIK